MGSDSIVRVSHLSHRYSVQWAVRDVSFEIGKNGTTGLLGSNGAGKSTIMNIVCGVLAQTDGDVYVNGEDIRRSPIEAKRNIGFLPQKPPVYGDLTVSEYLRYAASLRRMDSGQIEKAVEDVEERCGIRHFSNRLIRNLSGGYQQRVGIAQAIIHKPKLVVMDEPTNGLDPNQILEIRTLIKDIAKDCAVLISTHILSEVQAICDDILMIEHGSLVFSGTMDEFDNYVEPETFVATFIGDPSEDDLKGIPGVTGVESLSEFKSQYRFWFDGDKGTMERVVGESVARGWGLTEIRLEKSSMNEIFAQLSGRSKGI